SGLEVLSRLREMSPHLRAIVLTAYPNVKSAVESMKMGALDYVKKGSPNLAADLKAKVKEALERNTEPDVQAAQTGEQAIADLIAKGESAELEFKSSARWDVRASRINKELERVIVKTVAAFMNSKTGGTLLIGVD